MRVDRRFWVMMLMAGLTAAYVGCGGGVSSDEDGNSVGAVAGDTPVGKGDGENGSDLAPSTDVAPEQAPTVEPPPPPTIPEVRLTDALRETCIAGVDGTMPEAELPGLDGQVHALRSLYGEKLTVVCFWTIGSTPTANILAESIVEDLVKDVFEPYADKGVQVIAIDVGDSIQNVDSLASTVGAKNVLPIFVDADGSYFARVAHEKLPRIYLIDAGGKILWFDMEYSETTRRELGQAIQVVLGEV